MPPSPNGDPCSEGYHFRREDSSMMLRRIDGWRGRQELQHGGDDELQSSDPHPGRCPFCFGWDLWRRIRMALVCSLRVDGLQLGQEHDALLLVGVGAGDEGNDGVGRAGI